MQKKQLLFVCFVLSAFIISGCHRTPKPAGLPKLYPATLTVTQEGVPLKGATITLVPDGDSQCTFSVGGISDEQGVVTLATYGKFKGAPLGKWKVCAVTCTIEEYTDGPPRLFNLIDPVYEKEWTTPLTIETTKKTNETIDFGPQVKTEIF